MRKQRPDLLFLLLIVVVLAAAAGLTVLIRQFIVPLGGDQVYAPIWEAARFAFASPGANPYSPEAVSRAAALLVEESLPVRFAYPYYSLALFSPFARITPYSLSRAVWMTFSLACAIGLAFGALRLTRWRPGLWGGLAFAVFAFGRPEVLRALFLGNPALAVSLFSAIGLILVIQDRDGLAGIFFALTLVKPQMSILLLAFVLVWAVSQRRVGLAGSMLVTAAILFGGSFAVFPEWLAYNIREMLAFFVEGFPASPAAVTAGWFPGREAAVFEVTAGILGAVMVFSWWRALGKNSRWFLWTAALTIVISNLIGLPTSLSNQVLLLVPFSLVFSAWAQRWKGSGLTLAIVVMGVIVAADWGLFMLTMDGSLTGPPSAVMLFFLPLTALVLLYWVRYWALYSIQLRTSHLEALRRL